jgi:hypothetical protein
LVNRTQNSLIEYNQIISVEPGFKGQPLLEQAVAVRPLIAQNNQAQVLSK